MNTKQKIARGLVSLALLAGSCFAGKAVYNRGYESGRQEIRTKVHNIGNNLTRKCEDDIKYTLHAMSSDTNSEIRKAELQIEYGCAQERYDAIRDLVREVTINSVYNPSSK